jgi:hypothetical protein
VPNDFDKFLENLDKEPTPAAEPEKPVEEAPAGPPDPLAHLIGHKGAIQERSPFDAFLDGVADEAPKDIPEEEPRYEEHDWKAVRKTLYEDDHDVWRCQRCFRQINVDRNETLNQACDRHNLNRNCAVQVAAEVMET